MSRAKILGVLSDTHLYRQEVPLQVMQALDGVDLLIHAGDIVEMAVLEELESLAPTVAVAGNMDHGDVREALPEKRIIDVAGRRLGLVHGSGAPQNITSRLRRGFDQVDVVIFGHTHQVCNRVEDGIFFFNPGSPTDKMFASFRSVGIIELGEEVQGRIIMLE